MTVLDLVGVGIVAALTLAAIWTFLIHHEIELAMIFGMLGLLLTVAAFSMVAT